MDYGLTLSLLAPIIAAVGAYFIAKRTTSGNIDTSDAATLWAESQAIRKDLRDEIVLLRGEVGDLKQDVIRLEKDKVIDHKKIADLLAKIVALEERFEATNGKI